MSEPDSSIAQNEPQKRTPATSPDIAARVRQVIESVTYATIAMDEARLGEDLRADGLDVVEITMALEEDFGFEIPDEDAERYISEQSRVRDVIEYVQRRCEAQ